MRTQRVMLGVAFFLVRLCVVSPLSDVLGVVRRPLRAEDILAPVGLVASAVFLSAGFSRGFVFTQDSVERITWFSRRTLARAQIRGIRVGKLPARAGGSYYIIDPLEPGKAELEILPPVHQDRWFYQWMKSFPRIETKGSAQRKRPSESVW